MEKVEESEITYIAFLECVFRGRWVSAADEKEGISENSQNDFNEYSAIEDGSQLWVVMPDRLRRAFRFKESSLVFIYGSTVRFDQNDVIEELAVDEEKQEGKI